MSSVEKIETRDLSRLEHFPISFLAMVLGLLGFTLVWQRAEHILHLPFQLSTGLLYFTLAVMSLVIALYTVKAIRFPRSVAEEYRHPVKINFFPILAKLALILSIIFMDRNIDISYYSWWLGVILQFGFSISIMTAWIQHDRFELLQMNPSWFIPIVGSIIVPIAGTTHASAEISWFFFSVGLFWWLVLFALVMNRMIFHASLPQKLLPTMFILFAPPVIGFISLSKLIGPENPAGKILYYFGLFMFALVLAQLKLLTKIPFFLSWWAYSFPTAAMTLGTFLMYHETGLEFFRIASWVLFVAINLIIIMLVFKSIGAMRRKTICVAE